MREQDSIRSIKGIGEKTEKLFTKLGIATVGDFLRYYPRDYDEYKEPVSVSEAEEGKKTADCRKSRYEQYRKKNCSDGFPAG